jgi:hypothetical protein
MKTPLAVSGLTMTEAPSYLVEILKLSGVPDGAWM